MSSTSQFKKSIATGFSRARQYTGEKLGRSERTQYDEKLEELAAKSDKIKAATEKILKATEQYLQPNPNRRIQNSIYSRISSKSRTQTNELEHLGQTLADASENTDPSTTFGKALAEVGALEGSLGELWRVHTTAVVEKFAGPLKEFVNAQIKTAASERKALASARLDLDAAKSRLKKAQASGVAERVVTAEADVQEKQDKFDRQSEVTRLLLENVDRTHEDNLHRLTQMVEAQQAFFAAAAEATADVAKQLKRRSGDSASASSRATSQTTTTYVEDRDDEDDIFQTAKVLMNYDASGPNQISVVADEIVLVHRDAEVQDGWISVEKNGQHGIVPAEYVEFD